MAASPKKNKNQADINIDTDMDITIKAPSSKSPEDDKKKKKKGMGCLIFFIIIILVIAAAAAVLRFNLFGLWDNHVRGLVEKVPIVNNMLPPVEPEDPLTVMTTEELMAEIDALKGENESMSEEINRLKDLNSTYLKEIDVLKEFEENQLQFKEDKAAFDREVGLGNPVTYESYYEQISPENAADIYREVVGIVENDKEFKNFVSTYENMDESSAAAIFDQMARTDLDLTVRILENISSEQRAAIMASMTTASAEQVTRRMAPSDID